MRQYARCSGSMKTNSPRRCKACSRPLPDVPQICGEVEAGIDRADSGAEGRRVADGRRRRFRWSGSLSAAAMVVVVMLVCSAVYAWLQRPKSTAAHASGRAGAHRARAGAGQHGSATAPPPAAAASTRNADPPASGNCRNRSPRSREPVRDGNCAGETKPAETKPAVPESRCHRARGDHGGRSGLGAGARRWQVCLLRHAQRGRDTLSGRCEGRGPAPRQRRWA